MVLLKKSNAQGLGKWLSWLACWVRLPRIHVKVGHGCAYMQPLNSGRQSEFLNYTGYSKPSWNNEFWFNETVSQKTRQDQENQVNQEKHSTSNSAFCTHPQYVHQSAYVHKLTWTHYAHFYIEIWFNLYIILVYCKKLNSLLKFKL